MNATVDILHYDSGVRLFFWTTLRHDFAILFPTGLFPFQTEGAVASAFQGADDLPHLVKALSTELEEMASEDSKSQAKSSDFF